MKLHPPPLRAGTAFLFVGRRASVLAFGPAAFPAGSPTLRSGEIVSSISATPSGNGYWLFTDRGRAYAYGDAHPYGDMGKVALNGPVIAKSRRCGSVVTP